MSDHGFLLGDSVTIFVNRRKFRGEVVHCEKDTIVVYNEFLGGVVFDLMSTGEFLANLTVVI